MELRCSRRQATINGDARMLARLLPCQTRPFSASRMERWLRSHQAAPPEARGGTSPRRAIVRTFGQPSKSAQCLGSPPRRAGQHLRHSEVLCLRRHCSSPSSVRGAMRQRTPFKVWPPALRVTGQLTMMSVTSSATSFLSSAASRASSDFSSRRGARSFQRTMTTRHSGL